ncbi:MAG: 30S ribosomal protein S20 [Candidatus Acidiferrales bacterium]
MPAGTPTKVKKKKKSVLKRARLSLDREAVNRSNKTRVRSIVRKMRAALASGDATAAGELHRPTMAALDHAVTKGVLPANTANRYKSRISLALNHMRAARKA